MAITYHETDDIDRQSGLRFQKPSNQSQDLAIYEHEDGKSQPFFACPRHSEGARKVADYLPEGHRESCAECDIEADLKQAEDEYWADRTI